MGQSSTSSELLQACREAEAWCALKSEGPAYRAEVLRPLLSELPAVDELHNVLETIRRRRHNLLASDPIPQSLRGRLLACEFNASIASGESEHEVVGSLTSTTGLPGTHGYGFFLHHPAIHFSWRGCPNQSSTALEPALR